MLKRILKFIFASAMAAIFLSIGVGQGCESLGLHYRERPSLSSSADQLHTTLVTPHLEVPINPGTNVLWCGTFQLAWNQLCALAGGPLRFTSQTPEMAEILNRQSMTSDDLDDASYVAIAGYVRDGITEKIRHEVIKKFHDPNLFQHLPALAQDDHSNAIVTYCCLYKNLQFPTPFERLDEPLNFAGSKVACFGMDLNKQGQEQMARQILILDYHNRDDFIIELQTQSPRDRLILAKIAPASTLAATIALVQKRMVNAKPVAAYPSDVMAVPKMNFDINKDFTPLTGLHLLPTSPRMGIDLEIDVAEQDTKFLMDEKGVTLKSEAQVIALGCSSNYVPPPQHQLIFDKPFLVLMARQQAKSPYFALWVGNDELLVGAE